MRRLLAVAFLSAAGCSSSPTGPDPPELTHPNELLMSELLQCNARFHELGHIDLFFWQTRRWFTNADGLLVFAACGAWPGASYVECERTWLLEAAPAELAEAAAHEVCHITGDLTEPPLDCMAEPLKACKLEDEDA